MDPSLWELVGGALRLDRQAFASMAAAPNGLRLALTVLVLAGISETVGQSVVLVLNQVSKRRFVLALVLGGLQLVCEALVWMLGVWIVASVLAAAEPSFREAARTIALAYAPLLLGVFVFLPYVGPMIGRLLRLWALLAAIVGTSVIFGISPLGAALAAAGGFAARFLLLRVFGGVFGAVDRWFWRARTGQAMPVRSSDTLLPQERRG